MSTQTKKADSLYNPRDTGRPFNQCTPTEGQQDISPAAIQVALDRANALLELQQNLLSEDE